MGAVLSGGLVLTAIYGLLGLGFVVVYRASGVLNFAQGAVMLLGGYFGFALANQGLNALVVFPLVALIGFAAGWLFYLLVMRRMVGQPLWAPVLVTVAVGFFVLPGVIRLIWGSGIYQFNGSLGFENSIHELPGGISMTTLELVLVIAFIVLEVGLLAFYQFSKLGIQMRAASQDQRLAAYRAVNIDLVTGLAWGFSTALVMFVGFSYSTNSHLELGAAVIVLKAFPAAMAGGMDSIAGVVFGALLIGMGEAAVQIYISTIWSEAVPFLVLFLVLLIRPWGLRGTPELIDRV